MTNWLIYLFEVSICHALFYLLFLGLFRNLSFFQVNRIYLLSAAILGFIIPAIQIPFWDNHASEIMPLQMTEVSDPLSRDSNANIPNSDFPWLISLVFIAYLGGMILYFSKLVSTIIKVSSLIRKYGVKQCSDVKTVHLNSGPAIFVFLNYVFINMNKMNISSIEFQQVIEHEKNHIFQRHTLDNIMMELIITVCWFNPILQLIKKELNSTHEFYVDQRVTQNTQDLDSYSRLILRLSSNKEEHIPLTHPFSMYNIKRRITMLNTKKNKNSQLLRYIMIVPCLAMLAVSFSFVEKSTDETNKVLASENSVVISKITWNGNTLYTSEFLSNYVGIRVGDQFNEAAINQKLSYQPEGSDLASLFMDEGYLFFTVNVKKEEHSGTVDLIFDIYEGDKITINKVFVTGNQEADSEKILSMISFKPGEHFNRSKLVASLRKIAESGLVDPENVAPNLIPHLNNRTVDIEFVVGDL
ncbi:M56 family metallopeptidase [Pleomorphovibrio marinus]|uniref:M56 family metallopeptidase n=1 Tax=Pleomorphovibrio marinus TaxID=2164132 RepID=UPI000E09E0BA|nr:M56 family metallopeptidase [Pleomorphovibrio marinus]